MEQTGTDWSPSGSYSLLLNCTNKTEAQNAYDVWAQHYDKDIHAMGVEMQIEVAKYVTKYLPNSKETAVLDVGAGTGLNGEFLRKNESFPGIIDILDANMEMLYLASKKGLKFRNIIRHWVGDGELPLTAKSYDLVVSIGTFFPLHFPVAALVSLLKVVKEGGFLIFNLRRNVSESYVRDLTDLIESLERNKNINIIEKKKILYNLNGNTIPSELYICRKGLSLF